MVRKRRKVSISKELTEFHSTGANLLCVSRILAETSFTSSSPYCGENPSLHGRTGCESKLGEWTSLGPAESEDLGVSRFCSGGVSDVESVAPGVRGWCELPRMCAKRKSNPDGLETN